LACIIKTLIVTRLRIKDFGSDLTCLSFQIALLAFHSLLENLGIMLCLEQGELCFVGFTKDWEQTLGLGLIVAKSLYSEIQDNILLHDVELINSHIHTK
jgi:hypothetical protein